MTQKEYLALSSLFHVLFCNKHANETHDQREPWVNVARSPLSIISHTYTYILYSTDRYNGEYNFRVAIRAAEVRNISWVSCRHEYYRHSVTLYPPRYVFSHDGDTIDPALAVVARFNIFTHTRRPRYVYTCSVARDSIKPLGAADGPSYDSLIWILQLRFHQR